jgi:hypothetical protein
MESPERRSHIFGQFFLDKAPNTEELKVELSKGMTSESLLTSIWAMSLRPWCLKDRQHTLEETDAHGCERHTPRWKISSQHRDHSALPASVCGSGSLSHHFMCDVQDGEGEVLGFEDIKSNRVTCCPYLLATLWTWAFPYLSESIFSNIKQE